MTFCLLGRAAAPSPSTAASPSARAGARKMPARRPARRVVSMVTSYCNTYVTSMVLAVLVALSRVDRVQPAPVALGGNNQAPRWQGLLDDALFAQYFGGYPAAAEEEPVVVEAAGRWGSTAVASSMEQVVKRAIAENRDAGQRASLPPCPSSVPPPSPSPPPRRRCPLWAFAGFPSVPVRAHGWPFSDSRSGFFHQASREVTTRSS